MFIGSLSENNVGVSLDNFTVFNSEIIMHRANRLLSVISGGSCFHNPLIRKANYLMENAVSWVLKLRR